MRELWLCDNLIGSAGVRALAAAVADGHAIASLSTLALGGNPGAADLSEAHAATGTDGTALAGGGKENTRKAGGSAGAEGKGTTAEKGVAREALEAAVGLGSKSVLSLGSVVIDGRQTAGVQTFDRRERYQSMRPLYEELNVSSSPAPL